MAAQTGVWLTEDGDTCTDEQRWGKRAIADSFVAACWAHLAREFGAPVYSCDLGEWARFLQQLHQKHDRYTMTFPESLVSLRIWTPSHFNMNSWNNIVRLEFEYACITQRSRLLDIPERYRFSPAHHQTHITLTTRECLFEYMNGTQTLQPDAEGVIHVPVHCAGGSYKGDGSRISMKQLRRPIPYQVVKSSVVDFDLIRHTIKVARS